jgi:hypothetical protein
VKFRLLAIVSVSLLFSLPAGASTPRWFQPLLALPHTDLLRAECVILHESRSTLAHPNLGDDNGNIGGQSGIFQMSNSPGGIWDTYVLPVLHVLIWRASPYQQAEGFMLVWRVDRFEPWHRYDNC